MNDWLKILEAFREGKFIGYYYGLTARFVIGGSQSPVGEKFETRELAYEATKRMFDQMRVFNYKGKVVVSNRLYFREALSSTQHYLFQCTLSSSNCFVD